MKSCIRHVNIVESLYFKYFVFTLSTVNCGVQRCWWGGGVFVSLVLGRCCWYTYVRGGEGVVLPSSPAPPLLLPSPAAVSILDLGVNVLFVSVYMYTVSLISCKKNMYILLLLVVSMLFVDLVFGYKNPPCDVTMWRLSVLVWSSWLR